MREAQKKTIDGITFEVTPLGHSEARRGFVRLARVLGPVLGAAASGGTFAAADPAKALGKLSESLTDEDLVWFSDAFGKGTRFSSDGAKWPYLNEANREALFQGRILLFFEWLAFALEVNYSDFLDWLKSAGSGGEQKE